MRLRRKDREPAIVPSPNPSSPKPSEPPESNDPSGALGVEESGGQTPIEPDTRIESEPASSSGVSNSPARSEGPSISPGAAGPSDSGGVTPTSSDQSSRLAEDEPVTSAPPSEGPAAPESFASNAPVSESNASPVDRRTESTTEGGPDSNAAEPQRSPAVHDAAGRSRDRSSRAPSIPEEADELLNGKRPSPRALPRVIAIANQKGGVGKTTTTVNLGAALAEQDYRVLVIDLDPQANATTGLGVEPRNFEFSMYDVIMRDHPLEDTIEPTSVKNLFVAPATIDLAGIEIELVPAFSRELKLKKAVDSVVEDFDFVLIDCPPSLGLITVNGLAAADEVLVPIQCEYYALEGLSQLLRNVNLVSTNLNETLEVTTIVLTMFDARTRLSVDVANEVRKHFSERVCKSVIPRTVRLSEAPSFGQPITVFDPASRGAVAYRELAKEVSNGAPQRTR
jgi:chromosome partitioning protein